ncbi:uncharacterized protein BO96DRAFT_244379 [Aspergillus niger CBS 101883]|uniref:uncharacterized protein n=1 Tax=Aspergillus lacticoffeatus (strain CBS 101883) TaxID=1450533 RepID=UPI000D7F3B32|nr:uncharacterized protein BO96DRAFT_244379 [Aspergillus niger CBS 101883]PYH58568.1 hypothetical protein BO96DRAFT_244379 [Aspergillus niger CBS 101883]
MLHQVIAPKSKARPHLCEHAAHQVRAVQLPAHFSPRVLPDLSRQRHATYCAKKSEILPALLSHPPVVILYSMAGIGAVPERYA